MHSAVCLRTPSRSVRFRDRWCERMGSEQEVDVANMTVGRLQKQIEAVEKVRVRISRKARYVRGKTLAPYRFQRMGFNRSTVSQWTEGRFEPNYPDLDVEILLGDGMVAKPRRKLEGVRKTYLTTPRRWRTSRRGAEAGSNQG